MHALAAVPPPELSTTRITIRSFTIWFPMEMTGVNISVNTLCSYPSTFSEETNQLALRGTIQRWQVPVVPLSGGGRITSSNCSYSLPTAAACSPRSRTSMHALVAVPPPKLSTTLITIRSFTIWFPMEMTGVNISAYIRNPTVWFPINQQQD